MTADITLLDAHEQPSDQLRAKWKTFAKMDQGELSSSGDIDDLKSPEKASEFVQAGEITATQLASAFTHLVEEDSPILEVGQSAPIYYHPLVPGLLVVPSVIPPELQKTVLKRLIHRDLGNPRHQTNLHLHYDLPYPGQQPGEDSSFFSYPPDSEIRFTPKDSDVHRPLSIKQVMDRRLHWVTLGGQYDWTSRVYPEEPPPEFPPDLAAFLQALFPETVAQAAIVNFYSPGDTMMVHRDVSEETDKGLISLSLGCDSLFMIAPNDAGKMSDEELQAAGGEKQSLVLRLRSGDAIYMTKESRFAWHGVPRVLKGTCPTYLADWPAEDGQYEDWRGWMKNKRINLNVRQMKD